MINEVDELINFTKLALNLDSYFLKRYHFYENVNVSNEIFYSMSMEWFPEQFKNWHDDELNPDGTAVVEIDLATNRLISVIFVGEKTFVTEPLIKQVNRSRVIDWIENNSQLIYGEHFHLIKETDRTYIFSMLFNHVTIYPPSDIKVQFNQDGHLIEYTIHGTFPDRSLFEEDVLKLSLDEMEHIIDQQLKYVHFPDDEQKQLHAIYGIEEVFIRNSDLCVIDYEIFEKSRSVMINEVMTWDVPLDSKHIQQQIHLVNKVTSEQVFSSDQQKILPEITEDIQNKCVANVRHFLRQQYPTDSGKWKLVHLHRENNYIIATLRLLEKTNFIFQRKLTVFINENSFDIVNYIDNESFLNMFSNFKEPSQTKVSKKVAYEKLRDYITLEPIYVFDPKQEQYILCGKLDCQYGVDAVSGQMVNLNDL